MLYNNIILKQTQFKRLTVNHFNDFLAEVNKSNLIGTAIEGHLKLQTSITVSMAPVNQLSVL